MSLFSGITGFGSSSQGGGGLFGNLSGFLGNVSSTLGQIGTIQSQFSGLFDGGGSVIDLGGSFGSIAPPLQPFVAFPPFGPPPTGLVDNPSPPAQFNNFLPVVLAGVLVIVLTRR